MKGDEDAIYVKSFKDGDEKAFDYLYEKYQISIHAICYRYTRNEADARELTQDVFIKVYNNLNKFRGKSKFFTWLYRIAVNTCFSFKRKHKEPLFDLAPAKESVDLGKRVRMKIAIDNALLKLPKRQKLCFILRHYEGHTFSEIGDIMDITTGAAKANHHHAVKKLRVLLEAWT
ncbi:MAG: RNA polymerase sigma factor [bacterium]